MKKRWLVLCLIIGLALVGGCSRIESTDEASSFNAEQETDVSAQSDADSAVEDSIEDDMTTEESVPDKADLDDAYNLDWDNVDTSKVDITLPDEFFLQYMDDIYQNMPNYLNKVVSGEGYILYMNEEGTEFAFCRDYVCCGPDAYPVGIICRYDGDIPPDDTWVTITGVVGKEEGQFTDMPVLHVTELKKTKEKKGQRLVDY